MKSSVIRTAIASSVLTAILVTAVGLWAGPKLLNPQSPTDGLMQPALYNGQNSGQTYSDQTVQPQLTRRPVYRRTVAERTTPVYRDSYGEPVVHRHRSTQKSALIVAGSAGTGAAIGAIAGGGKGAAIGAISGGVAGFIYDRLTANK